MIYTVCSREQRLITAEEQRETAQHLLNAGLSQEYNITVQNDSIVRNAWGKPLLASRSDVHFNISHCKGGVALSISCRRTGIDMERIRPYSSLVARKVLSESEYDFVSASEYPEREFFRLWTLKECYVKALGTGLSYPLKRINFIIGDGLDVHCNKKGCSFRLIENELEFITAVCYLGADRPADDSIVSKLLP